ncbi:MAG: response regulator [Anaerolineales bacterium]
MEKTRKSILLIEDDPNDAALFKRALRKLNLATNLTVIEDGDAAIRWFMEKASSTPEQNADWPWIVLLDIKMPRMTGMEVLEWLRRQSRFCRLPVIAFTSSREPADIAQAYRLGVNSYLVKPLSFDQWKEMIRMIHHYWMELNERPDVR